MSESADAELLKSVLAALENPRYQWRTIGGVAKETGVGVEKVLDILTGSDVVVRSSVPSKSGDALFTTRARFRDSASFAQKLRGAFTNRLD